MTTEENRAVQSGLDSKNTYVILIRNGRLGVHLGLRPHVQRVDKNTIWLGGRLRTAFDFDGVNRQTKKEQVADLTEAQAIKLLKKEFPGFTWETGSDMRCSTTVGIMIAAGKGDSAPFKKLWDDVDYVGALLGEIQNKVKQPIIGVKGVKKAKSRCVAELSDRYEKRMGNVFDGYEHANNLNEKVLGQISSLMNETAVRSYTGTREAFIKKVEKEQAKAIA